MTSHGSSHGNTLLYVEPSGRYHAARLPHLALGGVSLAIAVVFIPVLFGLSQMTVFLRALTTALIVLIVLVTLELGMTRQRVRVSTLYMEPMRRSFADALRGQTRRVARGDIREFTVTPSRYGLEWTSPVSVTLAPGRRIDINSPTVGPEAFPFLLEFLGETRIPISAQDATPRTARPTLVSRRRFGLVLLIAWFAFVALVANMAYSEGAWLFGASAVLLVGLLLVLAYFGTIHFMETLGGTGRRFWTKGIMNPFENCVGAADD